MPFPQFSTVLTGPEFINHLVAHNCDYLHDLHPNIVPFQACNPARNMLVRAANMANVVQKTIAGIDGQTEKMKANAAFVNM